MRHLEDVRRLMGPTVVFNGREKSRCFITGRLHDPTVATRQSRLHQRLPGVLIPCRCQLVQHHVVAHGFHPHQTQTACTRFILRQRDLLGWHLLSQARARLAAGCHDRFCNAMVDLLLRPLGGADKPIAARDLPSQTHQAHPTGPHFDTHQVDRQDQAMQEGATSDAVKKRHDRGTLIKARLIRTPRLQRAAGNLKPLDRLTLGDALGVQIAISLKQVSTCDASPALVAILIATWRVWDDRVHSDLLFKPFAFTSRGLRRARSLAGFNPSGYRVAEFLGRHLYQVADAVIEARFSVTKYSLRNDNA